MQRTLLRTFPGQNLLEYKGNVRLGPRLVTAALKNWNHEAIIQDLWQFGVESQMSAEEIGELSVVDKYGGIMSMRMLWIFWQGRIFGTCRCMTYGI